MNLIIGGVYVTEFGKYLRLESIGDLLLFFIVVDENNEPIPEIRNRLGHVTFRNRVSYSPEVVSSFKKVKI